MGNLVRDATPGDALVFLCEPCATLSSSVYLTVYLISIDSGHAGRNASDAGGSHACKSDFSRCLVI